MQGFLRRVRFHLILLALAHRFAILLIFAGFLLAVVTCAINFFRHSDKWTNRFYFALTWDPSNKRAAVGRSAEGRLQT